MDVAAVLKMVFGVVGGLGIFLLGIFVTWFPISALRVPLPTDPVGRLAVTGTWQTLAVIVLPYVWASARLGMSPARLGLTRRRLGRRADVPKRAVQRRKALRLFGGADLCEQLQPVQV